MYLAKLKSGASYYCLKKNKNSIQLGQIQISLLKALARLLVLTIQEIAY